MKWVATFVVMGSVIATAAGLGTLAAFLLDRLAAYQVKNVAETVVFFAVGGIWLGLCWRGITNPNEPVATDKSS